MTEAERQAYEAFLNYWIVRALQYEHLAHVQMGYIEGIETLMLIGREELIGEEIEKARQHFEKMTREEAA